MSEIEELYALRDRIRAAEHAESEARISYLNSDRAVKPWVFTLPYIQATKAVRDELLAWLRAHDLGDVLSA